MFVKFWKGDVTYIETGSIDIAIAAQSRANRHSGTVYGEVSRYR
jgi:hypothetical protein